MAQAGRATYSEIIRSTALIGGSSVISIAIGIVRAKAIALMLGPSGVGLIGLYSSVTDIFQTFGGLGVGASGVRQIAEVLEDSKRLARTARVLSWLSTFLGIFGAILLMVAAHPVADLTFGGSQYSTGVALLGIAVCFRIVSAGQGALLQGMRQISALARISVISALFGAILSIPIIYFLREEGIVLSLIAVAAASLLTSWWFTRKIPKMRSPITMAVVKTESAALLKLGFVFMLSGLLSAAASYAVRLIVLRNVGIEAAGYYQAAWVLGGMYVGFILQAMGADFYPRLTAAGRTDVECNRLVNEQSHISILFAAPGVIGTVTFAPLVMVFFYSAEFEEAATLLRWICMGMLLRVVAWPLGFIILARGAQRIMLWTEVAAAIAHLGFAICLVPLMGSTGAGAAFFALYLWHSALVYVIVRRLTGFRWTKANRRLIGTVLLAASVVFCAFLSIPSRWAMVVGSTATFAIGAYAMHGIGAVVGHSTPDAIRRVGCRLRKALAWTSAGG